MELHGIIYLVLLLMIVPFMCMKRFKPYYTYAHFFGTMLVIGYLGVTGTQHPLGVLNFMILSWIWIEGDYRIYKKMDVTSRMTMNGPVVRSHIEWKEKEEYHRIFKIAWEYF